MEGERREYTVHVISYVQVNESQCYVTWIKCENLCRQSTVLILRLQMIHPYYPYYLSLLKELHDFYMSLYVMES